MTENQKEKKSKSQHPIRSAIGRLDHQVRDIEFSLKEFFPLSKENLKKRAENITATLEDLQIQLKETDESKKAVAIAKTVSEMKKLERLINTKVPTVLKKSLFLGLFSIFDSFTGELLEAIFKKKPELFNTLKSEISVVDVLKFTSFEEFKTSVLREKIDRFRRNSYDEQFDDLQKMFSLPLKEFDHWPLFMECAQRRNLITHCNGVVSEQYIDECRKAGCKINPDLKIGDAIGLPLDYLLKSCNLVREVGIKLGTVLWRSIFPGELEDANNEYSHLIYDLLQEENWELAIELGRFSLTFKKGDDVIKKINVVNYAIALRAFGEKEKIVSLFSGEDWSGALLDFQLAKAVLLDDYSEAVKIMIKIGKKGQILEQASYHIFPLFVDFRKKPEFLAAYERIYGCPFVNDLQNEVDKEKQKLDAKVEENFNEVEKDQVAK